MIVTFTTDFGTLDPYAGIMKGVVLGIAPEARLVDLTHGIRSHDVMEGAFVLATAARYFPPGTVHVAVVDPGVGSDRRPVAVRERGHYFVGPDNGLLSLSVGPDAQWRHLSADEFFLEPVSATFHGRDIFSPVAAHLAKGTPFESFGPVVADPVRLARPETPCVLHVDGFGNVVTSLRPEALPPGSSIRIRGRDIMKRVRTYADGGKEEIFLIEGSAGFIEIAMNRASAAERLGVARGQDFEVETPGAKQ